MKTKTNFGYKKPPFTEIVALLSNSKLRVLFNYSRHHVLPREHLQQVQGGLHLVREEGRDRPEELLPLRAVPLPAEALRGRGHQQGRARQQGVLLQAHRRCGRHAEGLRLRSHGRRVVQIRCCELLI